jgi:hypothetical protein
MGDGDLSRGLRDLQREDATGVERAAALRAAARLGRLSEALEVWASARPPPGAGPVEPDVVEALLEQGHGWGDPRLIGEVLDRPRVVTWARDPTGPTRLVVHDDLSWSRDDPATGGLVPVDLPEGMPWSTGRGADDISVDAFLLAPGGTRALLAVTFTESPMLDADEYAGMAFVDLEADRVLDARSPREDFLFHAASPDLTGFVVGLYHLPRLRRVGDPEEVALPLAGRFMQAWPGPGPDEVSVWWRPDAERSRLDRLCVRSGELRGPGLELDQERPSLVPGGGPTTWVLWTSFSGSPARHRMRWIDVETGEVQREIRTRVPARPPLAVDPTGTLAGFSGELRRLAGFRVAGRYPTHGPAIPGAPVPVAQGPTLQEVDARTGALLRGTEAARVLLRDVELQEGPGGPWLLVHGGTPGELRGRACDGSGRTAWQVRGGPFALDRSQLVVVPMAGRGMGWRADLLDPRTGARRPVRWRGRGGKTCGGGDVASDGTVAMATALAEVAVGRPEDAEPRWVMPRREQRYSPSLRWLAGTLVVLFKTPRGQGVLAACAAEDGRELSRHELGPVPIGTPRMRAAPGNHRLLVLAGDVYLLGAPRETPRALGLPDAEAACFLGDDSVVVVDRHGIRRLFAFDGTPGPTWEGPSGVRAVCRLPGGKRLGVLRGAWLGFEDLPPS